MSKQAREKERKHKVGGWVDLGGVKGEYDQYILHVGMRFLKNKIILKKDLGKILPVLLGMSGYLQLELLSLCSDSLVIYFYPKLLLPVVYKHSNSRN